jgi:glycosyltransferase involved in cell wall biosynthesis
MFLSDAPDQSSGLARITRDLATMLSSHPRFRVATLGWHGSGSIRLPFQQYQMGPAEFGESSLPNAWSDFARGEHGAICTIWDISRMLWLARPEFLTDETLRRSVEQVRSTAMIWSYFPIDSTGPNDRLTAMSRETLLGLNRILVTSPWAEGVIRRTIGDLESERRGLTWMPHPINTEVFNVGLRAGSSGITGSGSSGTGNDGLHDGIRIGCVATNQLRKDWPLVAETCAILRRQIPGLRLWWHIDVDVRHWSIPALLEDFGLSDITEVTHPPIQDRELAARYRACDITLHPGSEGFGYPIFESFACGVPAIHGRYASGASLMGTCDLMQYTVEPIGYRYETEQNCVRPVYRASDWADKVMQVLNGGVMLPITLSQMVDHLAVKHLYYPIRRWFEEGIRTA